MFNFNLYNGVDYTKVATPAATTNFMNMNTNFFGGLSFPTINFSDLENTNSSLTDETNIFSASMPNFMNTSNSVFNQMDFFSKIMEQQQVFAKAYKASNINTSHGSSDIKWSKDFNKVKFTEKENQMMEAMATRLNCSSNDLKALMCSESGCNPSAVNPTTGATGLIQFMPSTAKGLGTTTDKLKKMTIEEQLPYVEKYLANAKKSAGIPIGQKMDGGTLYALVFLPAFANKKILCSAGDKYYNANKGLDSNKDGQITKADLATRLSTYV